MRWREASLSPARRYNGCATGCAPSMRLPRPEPSPRPPIRGSASISCRHLPDLGHRIGKPGARGALTGLTAECGLPEIARATLESVGFQTRDLVDAMEADCGLAIDRLRVDGGFAASDWAMQFVADILPASVERPHSLETTAWGAAYVAGLSRGLCPPPREMMAGWSVERRFAPAMDAASARSAMPGGDARSPVCSPRLRDDPAGEPAARPAGRARR